MTTLILVRHGETDWNRDRRIQGSTDIPLNDTGRGQARDAVDGIRDLLAGETPVVVASDLSRARETAQIIAAGLGSSVSALYPGLRERSYGEAEGLDVDEYHRRWGASPARDVPGAESHTQLRDRAIRTLQAVVRDARRAASPSAPAVVAVAHGGLIREVMQHASAGELPLPGDRVRNGAAYPFLIERERIRILAAVS